MEHEAGVWGEEGDGVFVGFLEGLGIEGLGEIVRGVGVGGGGVTGHLRGVMRVFAWGESVLVELEWQ